MRGFKPVTSRLIARKERKKKRKMHEDRLRKIAGRKTGLRRKPGAWVDSGFDNAPPKTVGMRHLAVNAKRERMIEERCEEIERQNKLLLARMTQIMSSKGVFKRTTEVPPPGPRSLNIGTRRKELMRIVTENEKILSRINSVEPQYNVKQWEQDFEKMTAIRESLSNFYPDEFGNDAEATDAMKAAGVHYGGPSGVPSSGSNNSNSTAKSGGSVRSASAARSREKETRLDRVLLVSRERGGYAAERPRGAQTGGGGRRRPRRGQSAAASRRKPSSTSVMYNTKNVTGSIKPVPPQKNLSNKGKTNTPVGGRAAVTARAEAAAKAKAAAAKAAAAATTTTTQSTIAPEAMSAGLLQRNDNVAGSTNNTAQAQAAEEKKKKEGEQQAKDAADAATATTAAQTKKLEQEKKVLEANAKRIEEEAVATKRAAEQVRAEKEKQDVAAKAKLEKEKKKKESEQRAKEAAANAAATAAETKKLEKEKKEKKVLEANAKIVEEETVATKRAAEQARVKEVETTVSDTIEEDIQEEERRWDGDSAFTKQEFIDFYAGLKEWEVAVVVHPGELGHTEHVPISQDVTNANLERTMGRLPADWNMSANCKIDGEPLSLKKYKSLAAALEDAANVGKCGGINEYDDGTFLLMKPGQAILSGTGMTAYVAPSV